MARLHRRGFRLDTPPSPGWPPVVMRPRVVLSGVDVEYGAEKGIKQNDPYGNIDRARLCSIFYSASSHGENEDPKTSGDLFLNLHERLIDIDLQRGRRILAQSIRSTKDAQSLLNRLKTSSPIAMSGVRPILMGLGRSFKHLRERLACPLLHV
jgi:hypothetical protein